MARQRSVQMWLITVRTNKADSAMMYGPAAGETVKTKDPSLVLSSATIHLVSTLVSRFGRERRKQKLGIVVPFQFLQMPV